MNNPTVYKFIYESIADATQVDNSVEEMGLESEYKLLMSTDEYQLFAKPRGVEKNKDESIECTTKCKKESIKTKLM